MIYFNFINKKRFCKRLVCKSIFYGGERGIWTLAPITRPTPWAGAPLQPLEYFSKYKTMAERVGFEPTVPCGITSFQDWLLKPLGHLSKVTNRILPRFVFVCQYLFWIKINFLYSKSKPCFLKCRLLFWNSPAIR